MHNGVDIECYVPYYFTITFRALLAVCRPISIMDLGFII